MATRDLSDLFKESLDEVDWGSSGDTSKPVSGAEFDWSISQPSVNHHPDEARGLDWSSQSQTPLSHVAAHPPIGTSIPMVTGKHLNGNPEVKVFDWSSANQGVGADPWSQNTEPTPGITSAKELSEEGPGIDWSQNSQPNVESKHEIDLLSNSQPISVPGKSDISWSPKTHPSVQAIAFPHNQSASSSSSTGGVPVNEPHTWTKKVHFEPPAAPRSLIAARRMQQQTEVLMPEQDVIYKQYNPNAVGDVPPPPLTGPSVNKVPHVGLSTSPGPANQVHGGLPSPPAKPVMMNPSPVGVVAFSPSVPITQPAVGVATKFPYVTANTPTVPVSPAPVGAIGKPGPDDHSPFGQPGITMTPTSPFGGPLVGNTIHPTSGRSPFGEPLNNGPFPPTVAKSPFSGPVMVNPSQPTVSNSLFGLAFEQSSEQSVPVPKKDGLRVFVSLGFGGRIVMGGGRFGMKIGLATVSSALGSHPLMAEITSVPSALGSVSPFITERVAMYCESKSVMKENVLRDRFTTMSMRDSHLVWSYLASLLKPAVFGKPSPRTGFLSALWREGLRDHSIDVEDPIANYITMIVEGNLRKAIEQPNMHAISMAVASIHSAEFFRESILLFSGNIGKAVEIEDSLLLDVIRVCITAFASSSGKILSDENEIVELWKLYVPLIACLVKPEAPAGGGVEFLVHLGDLLCQRDNICGGHICILLSGKRASLDSVDASDSLLCLLGANHRDISHFYRLLDPCAMHFSEIFEYCQRVGKIDFFIPLQPWKYAYAAMLASDLGMFEIAEKYIQVVNAFVRAVPTGRYSVHFRNGLRDLESRINGSKPGVPSGGHSEPVLASIWSSLWS